MVLFDEWMERQMDQAWRYEDIPDILAEMIFRGYARSAVFGDLDQVVVVAVARWLAQSAHNLLEV